MHKIFKDPALIGYLVKEANEQFPHTQIGGTFLQAMFYLLTRKQISGFEYSLRYKGPSSGRVWGELKYAEYNEIVNVTWKDNEGYFITPGTEIEKFMDEISEKEKQIIRQIIEEYGTFNMKELNIIATAWYLIDNFKKDPEDIAKILKGSNPNENIEDILKKANICLN